MEKRVGSLACLYIRASRLAVEIVKFFHKYRSIQYRPIKSKRFGRRRHFKTKLFSLVFIVRPEVADKNERVMACISITRVGGSVRCSGDISCFSAAARRSQQSKTTPRINHTMELLQQSADSGDFA